MPPVRQASFTGGALAPGLHARTNLRDYANSLRLCRNMIPRQEGPLSNRPGLMYVGTCTSPVTSPNARLVPFVFGQGTLVGARSYVLEVVAGHIYVWKNGVKQAVDIATPYTSDEIPALKFVQNGYFMTICCRQRQTRELKWEGDTTWTLSTWALERTLPPPPTPTFTTAGTFGAPTPNPWGGDASNIPKIWEWVITAVMPESKSESLPCPVTLQASCVITTNHPCVIEWVGVPGAAEYNIYRGRNGKFGFIGSTVHKNAGTSTQRFNDDGQYPVYAETPPTARNPFVVLSTVGHEYDQQPQVVTYHDQRLVFANAWNAPGEVEMSRVGEYHNFDRSSPPKTEDAVTFNIVNRKYEEIRSLVSVRMGLLVMTNATEWLVAGSDGIIAQDDIALALKSHWGSSWLDPLIIGEEVLFLQDVGSTIRSMIPAIEDPGKDLTLLAQHFFQNYSIKDWCYAHEPFRLIWATRNDGQFLACTYVKEHDVVAWAQHDTGNGDVVESLCTIPTATEDKVYALVKRTVNGAQVRYLESFAPRLGQTVETGVFLDSARTYTGSRTTISDLTHLAGRTVYALATSTAGDVTVRGPYVVSPTGQITAGGANASFPASRTVHIGLPISAQAASLDVFSTQEEVRPSRKLIKKVFLEVQDSAPFRAGQRVGETARYARRPDGQEWPQEGYTGLAEVMIECDWDDSGAVVWQQTDPLPLTVLSLIREVEFGGH